MASNTNATSLTWQNYLDMDQDVKPWLQMPPSVLVNDAKLQLITDMACQWAQNYLGRAIAPTTFDRRFNGWAGWNGAYIELPYYPILEVTSVTEYWGVSGPHVLLESTPTVQIDGWQCDYLRGQLIRIFPGNVQKPWFPGSRSIEVVWTAGYNPLPADIKVSTLELIAYWWDNTQQQSGNRVGGAQYDPMETSPGLWQGVPYRIQSLFDPYVQIGMA